MIVLWIVLGIDNKIFYLIEICNKKIYILKSRTKEILWKSYLKKEHLEIRKTLHKIYWFLTLRQVFICKRNDKKSNKLL